ncbi:hypothetical protein OTU49_017477, partial [Cherax quadricarinatus]
MLMIVLVILALWVTAAWLVHSKLTPKALSTSANTSASTPTCASPTHGTTIPIITIATTTTTIPSDNTGGSSVVPSITSDGSNHCSNAITWTIGNNAASSCHSSSPGEQDREQTRRQRLLRKRQRLISRLYDLNQDADEILKLYFTSSSPPSNASSRPTSRSTSRDRDSGTYRLLGVTTRRESGTGRSLDLPTLRRRSEPVPLTSGVPSARAEAARGRISLGEDVPRLPVAVRPSDTTSLGSSDDSGLGVEVSDPPTGLPE